MEAVVSKLKYIHGSLIVTELYLRVFLLLIFFFIVFVFLKNGSFPLQYWTFTCPGLSCVQNGTAFIFSHEVQLPTELLSGLSRNIRNSHGMARVYTKSSRTLNVLCKYSCAKARIRPIVPNNI